MAVAWASLYSSDSTPSLETSICCGMVLRRPKKKKEKKKKRNMIEELSLGGLLSMTAEKRECKLRMACRALRLGKA